jgi:trimeric autotransporter adhesin
MKTFIRSVAALGLAVLLGAVAACNGDGNDARLKSIAVSPAASTITLGTTQQLTVRGTYSDGSTRDVTAQAAFVSNSPAVATVAQGGLATGVAAGAATVQATVASLTASATVTVAVSSVVVLHASPDAPDVNVIVDSKTAVSGLAFGQGTAPLTLATGAHTLAVQARLPGGGVATVIPATGDSLAETFAAATQYIIVAEGEVASIGPQIFTRPLAPVAAGQARVQVFHAAPAAPKVDVYVTAPGAGVAGATPLGSFSFKESLGPVSVPAGSYEIYVTLAGTKTVVFDSGSVPLPAGADLLIAAEQNTGAGSAPITLAVTDGTGNNSTLRDVATPAAVRVIHASPDAPAVSVYVNNSFATPLVPCLAFPGYAGAQAASCPTFTAYTPVSPPGSVTSTQVTPYGNPGVIAINAPLALTAGTQYSVYAVGSLAQIGPLVVTDDTRRLATAAKLRVIHASPAAGAVDVYLTTGSSISSASPVLTNVPFKADSGFLGVAAGSYYVTVTPTGTKTAAIGPLAVTLNAKGIYTAVAVDHVGGGAPLGLIALDDLAAP